MLEALAAFAKFCLYLGALAGAGTAFAWASLGVRLGEVGRQAPAIMLRGAVITLLAASASVLILAMRLGGGLEEPVLRAVFGGPAGLAVGLQIAGAILLASLSRFEFRQPAGRLFAGALLMSSFAVSGHAASKDVMSAGVSLVHVSAAAWWLGALLLLAPACRKLAVPELHRLVRGFSTIAMAIVASLVSAGALLVLALVNFAHAPWQSGYVQVLAAKIGLAACVLGIAAFNKFNLTPRLEKDPATAIRTLQATIGVETAIICAVLATTAVLTTYTSPHA